MQTAASQTREAGRADRIIENLGHGGDNTADLLARLDRDVLSRDPELVILLVGINDLLNSRHALSLDHYRENLRALTQRIAARGTKLLLVTIPPAYAPYLLKRHPKQFYGTAGPAGRIAAGNEVVHAVARESHLPVVELFDAFQRAGGASEQPESLIRNLANSGSEDGIHPTPAGYRLMGDVIAEAILRQKWQGTNRIACFGDSITYGVHVTGEGTASGETYPAFLARRLGDLNRLPAR